MISLNHRLLTLTDVEEAAQVLAQAFVEDPVVSFMLPIKATRVRTMAKFFRVDGEISIRSKRGYGVGEPLQGVVASTRGNGYSSRLIRPFLQMADSQKVIAYTDTVTPSNVPLYEHFGFRCVETRQIAEITVYALRRPVQEK